MSTTLLYVILFVFGLIIGSFLNVVIFRYSPEENLFCLKRLRGRSKCMSCQKQLKWYELIPLLSFVIQKRKCRGCAVKLSWQYFLVELASGLIFVFPAIFIKSVFIPATFVWLAGGLWILIMLSLLLVWLIDYRFYIIPDELNVFLGILGAALTYVEYHFHQFGTMMGSFIKNYAMLFGFRENIWINHLFGVAVALVIVGLIILLTRGRGMGMGDLKLVLALGLIFGWPDILFVLIFAFILGAILGIFLIIRGIKGIKEAVPFGPLLVSGSLLVIFFGQTILGGYFRIFNIF
ncbi:MAG: prepilin peptidase [Candidatus Pacebacteria bacterium]|nr:prepilin peptidase [Candidatus Paceibacterota bacterium]